MFVLQLIRSEGKGGREISQETWRPFIPAQRVVAASLSLPAPLGDEHLLSSGRRSALLCPAYLPEHYQRSQTDTDNHLNSRPAVQRRRRRLEMTIEGDSCRRNAKRKWKILFNRMSEWKTLEMKQRQQEALLLYYWILAVAVEVGLSPN
jgi:hypothetical protein